MAEKDDLEQLGGKANEFLKRRISRRGLGNPYGGM